MIPTDPNSIDSLNGQMLAQYSNGTTYFAHKDHLGSTRLLTKVDQSVQEGSDYLPFGEGIACGGAATTSIKFTGQERDSESGLDYFGARYLASSSARFLSPDPLAGSAVHIREPQRWNGFAYVLNNPLGNIDIGGLWSLPDHSYLTGWALFGTGGGLAWYHGGLHRAIEGPDQLTNHFSPTRQKEHFMVGMRQTQKQAYNSAVGHLYSLAWRAFDAIKGATHEDDLMGVIGEAVHLIQDSYAHTTRDKNGRITSMHCYAMAGTCSEGDVGHSHPGLRNSDGTLTPQAQGAVNATRAFLLLMENVPRMSQLEFHWEMHRFVRRYLDEIVKSEEQDKQKPKPNN
jgi:RHS repeat-associated protein